MEKNKRGRGGNGQLKKKKKLAEAEKSYCHSDFRNQCYQLSVGGVGVKKEVVEACAGQKT